MSALCAQDRVTGWTPLRSTAYPWILPRRRNNRPAGVLARSFARSSAPHRASNCGDLSGNRKSVGGKYCSSHSAWSRLPLAFHRCSLVGDFSMRQADYLAIKCGEPYGTLILTLSAIAIEVMMISAAVL